MSSSAPKRLFSKYWCITINNPSADELDEDWLKEDQDAFEYAIFASEVGEEGTPHIQGYVVFKNRKLQSGVKKMFPRAHLEVSRGTPAEASDYCKKDGNYVEVGTLPTARGEAGGLAQKRKYEAAWILAKAGKIEEIDADIRIKHYSSLKRVRQDYMEPAPDAGGVTGVWLYGESGTGKSKYAREHYPDYYLKACNKWWDGYQGESNVIMEDVDPKMPYLSHHLKLWADRHDFIAESKGSSMRIRPKNFVVTSQYKIEDVFKDDVETIAALKRRFKCIHFPTGPLPAVVSNM